MPQAAQAASHSSGDLFLGVRAASGVGSTNDYVIDLGQASQFETASSILTLNLGSTGTDLSNLFGGSASATPWYTRSDVFWGIAGTTGNAGAVGTDPAKTLFASNAQTTPGQQSSPWPRSFATTQGGYDSLIRGMASAYDASSNTNPAVVATNAVSQNSSSTNSWASYQPGGTQANSGTVSFTAWSPSIENSFGPSTATTSILDLYRMRPATSTGQNGDYLGLFFFNDNGQLTFVPASLIGTGNLAFANTSPSVAENAGTLIANIVRTGDTTSAATVNVSTVDGSALAGTDYTAINNQQVSFAVGDTQKSVVLNITNRHGAAGNRSLALHFSSPSTGFTVGGDATVTITAQITPSVVQLTSATFTAHQADASVNITLTRTGGTSAESVLISTTDGTGTGGAKAGTDFTGLTNTTVSFPTNATTATQTITLSQPVGGQPNKTFTVTLSGPSTNVTLGTPATATVTILASDNIVPTVSISSPAAAATITASSVTLSGTAKDNNQVASVMVSINGHAQVAASLGSSTILGVPWSLTTTTAAAQGLQGGLNNVQVIAVDGAGNQSAVASVSFTLIEKSGLSAITYVGANVSSSGGSVTGLLAGTTAYQVGKPYTATAKPAAGFVFDHWVIPGVSTNSTTAAVTFVYTDAILAAPTIKAYFVLNPFVAAKIGPYNGLLTPHAGTTASTGTVGFLNVTVTATGSFTGSLKIGDFNTGLTLGTANGLTGIFNTSGDATLNVSRPNDSALVLALHLDLTGNSAQITGTVKQYQRSTVIATSDVLLDRANFSATIPVPANYLVNKGSYTAVLPAKTQPIGSVLTTADYPQGTGCGTVGITSAGNVTFTLTLADGTAFIATAPLSKGLTVPLYSQLYTNKAGSISGLVALSDVATDSDLKATNCTWFRPWTGTQFYPWGWNEGVSIDLLGAKYNSSGSAAGASVVPGLTGVAAPNSLLTFSAGSLTNNVTKLANVSPTNLVTKFDSTDKSFSLVLTAASGKITGTFPHSDGTTPAFLGTVFQKGPLSGGRGFFLTTAPKVIDGTGTSGLMTLTPNTTVN